MSKIERYNIDCESGPMSASVSMVENLQGEWVRWEDVQNLLQKQEDNYAHETQLLTERINRLVSKND